MHLVAVNLGAREVVTLGARTVETGIRKSPVARAFVGTLGVEGDVVTDTRHHGGPDQAVYVYSRDDYDWWEHELGMPLAPGTFGDNLTVSSFGVHDPQIGTRLRVGDAEIELTAPRIPCSVFAKRMELPRWVKRFAAAERPGAYARVLHEGEMAPGDAIEVTPPATQQPTIVDLMRLHYDKQAPEREIRRLLEAPIAIRARRDLERRLRKLAAA